jgi:hypothetical protein
VLLLRRLVIDACRSDCFHQLSILALARFGSHESNGSNGTEESKRSDGSNESDGSNGTDPRIAQRYEESGEGGLSCSLKKLYPR